MSGAYFFADVDAPAEPDARTITAIASAPPRSTARHPADRCFIMTFLS